MTQQPQPNWFRAASPELMRSEVLHLRNVLLRLVAHVEAVTPPNPSNQAERALRHALKDAETAIEAVDREVARG